MTRQSTIAARFAPRSALPADRCRFGCEPGEGADVAINYIPTEEPDAQDVIQMIRAAGRNGVAIPGDLRDRLSASGCYKVSILVVCNVGSG